jgi:hypothetical protein
MSDSSIPDDPPEMEISDEELVDFFLAQAPKKQPEEMQFPLPPQDVTDLPDEDILDLPLGDDLPPVKVGDGSCVVCGAPTFRPPGLTKAGHRKRTPKYCDIHNPKLRVPQDGPEFTGVENQLKRIQEELADDLRLLGVMAGPLLPVTGVYVFENADPFTVALLKLCKNNQRALRILHRAASVAPVYEVAKVSAGAFYAMQVDMHRLDPHNTVSQRLGVARAFDTVYPEQSPGNVNNVTTNGTVGPPRYATIQ